MARDASHAEGHERDARGAFARFDRRRHAFARGFFFAFVFRVIFSRFEHGGAGDGVSSADRRGHGRDAGGSFQETSEFRARFESADARIIRSRRRDAP